MTPPFPNTLILAQTSWDGFKIQLGVGNRCTDPGSCCTSTRFGVCCGKLWRGWYAQCGCTSPLHGRSYVLHGPFVFFTVSYTPPDPSNSRNRNRRHTQPLRPELRSSVLYERFPHRGFLHSVLQFLCTCCTWRLSLRLPVSGPSASSKSKPPWRR